MPTKHKVHKPKTHKHKAGGYLVKGSIAAKAWGAKMKALRRK